MYGKYVWTVYTIKESVFKISILLLLYYSAMNPKWMVICLEPTCVVQVMVNGDWSALLEIRY